MKVTLVIAIAIGDIHGMAALLTKLLIDIDAYLDKELCGEDYKIIFLGDYVDRGPGSREVVKLVRSIDPNKSICLKGNHEEMMSEAAQNSASWDRFCISGGVETLASYGGVNEEFMEAMSWMRSLPTFYEDQQRIFVHAGIDPDKPLSDQTDRDRLWIRQRFITYQASFPKYIVHGHTPTLKNPPFTGQADVKENRCNLDSGACYGGALTAAFFNYSQPKPFHLISVS
jgi:serine/threonine protein phosphatase 1